MGASIFGKVFNRLGVSKKWQKNLQSLSLSKQLKWAKAKAKEKAKNAQLVAYADSTRLQASEAAQKAADLARISAFAPSKASFAPGDTVSSAPKTAPAPQADDSVSPLPILLGVGALAFIIWRGRK